ncbi:hypothetical protein [Coralliovum pocilloporae]|uniref:hypothetical protein n=1 Tax=Coralliovum pocilloporae TaxID=3066369 RepID=UPI0033074743
MAAAACLLLILILVGWLFTAFNAKYRKCVTLENGLNLGYEAVFDLSRSYFKPIAVPKFVDGTPLIRDEMWAIYITSSTVYGWALGPTSQQDYWYAWRADVGLTRKKDDPYLYQRLVSESGSANWDIDVSSIGTGALLNELFERPDFSSHKCQTNLITW